MRATVHFPRQGRLELGPVLSKRSLRLLSHLTEGFRLFSVDPWGVCSWTGTVVPILSRELGASGLSNGLGQCFHYQSSWSHASWFLFVFHSHRSVQHSLRREVLLARLTRHF